MAQFIQPGIICKDAKTFETEYREPIERGLSKDATQAAKNKSDERLEDIVRKLQPYLHRKDNDILSHQLGIPLQDVVLHLKQTRQQRLLYNEFKSHQSNNSNDSSSSSKNFFKVFSALRPVHNHPGSLVMKRNDQMEKNKAAAAKKVALETTTTTTTQPVTKTTTSREENASIRAATADAAANLMDTSASATTKPNTAADAVQEAPRFDPLEVIDLMSDDDDDDEDEDVVDKEALADAVVAVLEKKATALPLEKEVPETQQVAAPKEVVARDEDKVVWWNQAKNSSHMQAEAGHKVVVLLHLLVEASKLQEKTVVFVNCIPVSLYRILCTKSSHSDTFDSSHLTLQTSLSIDLGVSGTCAPANELEGSRQIAWTDVPGYGSWWVEKRCGVPSNRWKRQEHRPRRSHQTIQCR